MSRHYEITVRIEADPSIRIDASCHATVHVKRMSGDVIVVHQVDGQVVGVNWRPDLAPTT